jgi:glycosyltransferase 2 family protein
MSEANLPSRPWLRLFLVVTGLLSSSLAILWLPAFHWRDLSVVAAATDIPMLAAAALLALTSNLTRGVRWWRLLDPSAEPRRCIGSFIGAMAINNLLPLRTGDVLRGVALSGAGGIAAAHGLAAVALERILDLAIIAALGTIGALYLGLPAAWFLGALALGCCTCLVCFARFAPRLSALASRPGWRRQIGHAAQGMDSLRSGHRLLQVLTLTIASWSLEVYSVWSASSAIGWHPTLATAAWLLAAGTMATILPAAPGSIGTMHAALAWAAISAGCTHPESVAFAIATHAAIWLPVTVIGVGWFCISGFLGRSSGMRTKEVE